MRPRVLFVTASYPTPDARTNGIFVREHARAAALHADVVVLHLHRGGALGIARVEGEDLPTWRVGYPRRPLALSYAGNFAALLAGYRVVRRSGFRPDLVHAHFFIAAAPALLLGLPVVTTEHWSVFLPSDPMQLNPFNRALARLAFRRSAAVLPVSGALRDAIAALGVRTALRVVPNAVDTALFRPATERDGRGGRLLAVSGLYGAKGYEYLLPAVARLIERGRAVRLDVVGNGVERPRYERIVHDLGLDGAVHFHGERPKAEVATFMREADLFVLASVYENNPCAVLEALVSGLPVVATRVGGLPEVVTSVRGELAPPADSDAFADAIDSAMGRGFDRETIARAAAAEFGLEAVGRALADTYEQVLGA